MPSAGQNKPASGPAPSALSGLHEVCVGAIYQPREHGTPTSAEPISDNSASACNSSTSSDSHPASVGADRVRQLTTIIRQRVEQRLPGRVRNLVVRMKDEVVVLEGRCATYYTKQLAQHAALGVLDDEQLENAIVVDGSH